MKLLTVLFCRAAASSNQKLERTRQPVAQRLRGKRSATGRAPLSFIVRPLMLRPVLSGVTYELFQFESDVLEREGSTMTHTIDGQVRLLMSDGTSTFVSWGNEPVQHAVCWQAVSFYEAENMIVVNASHHPLWKPLVGASLSFVVLDSEQQIVKVRSEASAVYLSSQEEGRWWSDVTTISVKRPSRETESAVIGGTKKRR